MSSVLINNSSNSWQWFIVQKSDSNIAMCFVYSLIHLCFYFLSAVVLGLCALFFKARTLKILVYCIENLKQFKNKCLWQSLTHGNLGEIAHMGLFWQQQIWFDLKQSCMIIEAKFKQDLKENKLMERFIIASGEVTIYVLLWNFFTQISWTGHSWPGTQNLTGALGWLIKSHQKSQ